MELVTTEPQKYWKGSENAKKTGQTESGIFIFFLVALGTEVGDSGHHQAGAVAHEVQLGSLSKFNAISRN